jgi:hypothetical protein
MPQYSTLGKRIAKITLSLALLGAANCAQARNITLNCAGSVVVLQDSSSAAAFSGKSDVYSREMTDFDRSIRLNKTGANEQEYLRAAARDVRNWSTEEQALLKSSFSAIDSAIRKNSYHIKLPDTIRLIKTTAKEEFGAEGYTRENRIMLNVEAQPISLGLVAHELFHVISRYNPQLRDRIYAVFHFQPCDNINYKPALDNKVITNPDCPFVAHYLSLDIDGAQKDVALIMYSPNDYHPGYSMDKYVSIGLLALTGKGKSKVPLIIDGKAVIYDLEKVPDFFTKVGTNTQYILHVEEISAEHFAGLMSGSAAELPQQVYVEGVKHALQQ